MSLFLFNAINAVEVYNALEVKIAFNIPIYKLVDAIILYYSETNKLSFV